MISTGDSGLMLIDRASPYEPHLVPATLDARFLADLPTRLIDRDLLVLATSNFPKAIDGAFTSRCDLVVTIPLPDETACYSILKHTIEGMASEFKGLKQLLRDDHLTKAAKACAGLDGRTVRKLVAIACTFDKQVALDPSRLTAEAICRAAEQARKERINDGHCA